MFKQDQTTEQKFKALFRKKVTIIKPSEYRITGILDNSVLDCMFYVKNGDCSCWLNAKDVILVRGNKIYV